MRIQETFKFWNLVRLILEVLRYYYLPIIHMDPTDLDCTLQGAVSRFDVLQQSHFVDHSFARQPRFRRMKCLPADGEILEEIYVKTLFNASSCLARHTTTIWSFKPRQLSSSMTFQQEAFLPWRCQVQANMHQDD